MANWNDIQEQENEKMSAGIYFCKITDARIDFTKNGGQLIKIKFATTDKKTHDESYFLSAKALFKIKRLLKSMQLTKEELSSIDFNMDMPEMDSDKILSYIKKFIVGKYAKAEIEIDSFRTNEKYTNYQIKQIRPMTQDELNENMNISRIECKFPNENNYLPLPANPVYPTDDNDVPF
jgi:hypothetical protein